MAGSLCLAVDLAVGYEHVDESEHIGALVACRASGGLEQPSYTLVTQIPEDVHRDDAAICAFRDQMVFTGGCECDVDESGRYIESSRSVNIWSSDTQLDSGRWVSRAPMLESRRCHSLVVVGNELWAMGGKTGKDYYYPELGGCANSSTLSSIEIYNSRANIWELAAPLPAQMHSYGAAFDGERMVVVGGVQAGLSSTRSSGRSQPGLSSSVYYCKPNQQSKNNLEWVMLPPLLHAVRDCSIALVNGKVLVAGGYTSLVLESWICGIRLCATGYRCCPRLKKCIWDTTCSGCTAAPNSACSAGIASRVMAAL